MRSLSSPLAALVLGLAVLTSGLAGQGSSGGTAKKPAEKPAPPQQTHEDGVARISPVEAHELREKGRAIIIDVRSESSYQAGHIQGALWMPDVALRLKELPAGRMIITYCSWPAEHTSARAVQEIKAKGMENAAALLGGYDAWIRAGFPTESGAPKTKDK